MRNFKNLFISILSATIAVMGLAGCQTSRDERTAGRESDDHKITEQVKDKLSEEPVFKFGNVDVRTFNGVVQLSGFVNTEDQKRRAAEVAQDVPHVAEVVNSISLKPQIPATPTGRPYPYQTPPYQAPPPSPAPQP